MPNIYIQRIFLTLYYERRNSKKYFLYTFLYFLFVWHSFEKQVFFPHIPYMPKFIDSSPAISTDKDMNYYFIIYDNEIEETIFLKIVFI